MATELSIVSGVGGRYANALFELAESENKLDAIAGELDRLSALIGESAELRRLVRSPISGRKLQETALAAIGDKAGFSDLLKRFLGVMVRNRRLGVIESAIREFRLLLARRRGETVARVVSAMALEPKQVDAVRAALRRVLGGEVTVDAAVDPALIGGLMVRVGSKLYDASLKTKLESIEIAMKGTA